MKNIEHLAKYLAEPIRKYVDKIASPILEKIKEIESKKINIQEIIDQIPLPKDGVDGRNGINGKNGKSFIDQLPEIGFPSKEEFIKSLKGRDGSNGTNGKDGVNGINGKSFLEQLTEMGFKNKDDFINSLKGKDGKDGIDGSNGLDGKDGNNGKSFLEQLPELGFTNKKSFIESLRGADGKNGANGINGKDALELEILPSIDESKQYDRGTYAKHQNGLWRSFEKTNGLRGWECIVVGIDSIEIEQTDDRKFSLKMTKSDGNQINKEFFMPIMVYRGVYKQGIKYEQGDTVTWGGSLWHCNQSTEVKPDDVENKHWTLAAKRGRDAK